MNPRFTIDGRPVPFRPGDTVAAALLREGIIRCGNSIYRDRPRGIVALGVEEPNAFVQVGGESEEPMVPVTTLPARDGLELRWLTGLGTLDPRGDSARYDKGHLHAEVVVVGSGPAGLAAAREAATGGARVVLIEQDTRFGGSLIGSPEVVEGLPAEAWIESVTAELGDHPDVRLLARTSVVGSYDNNYLVALQHREGRTRQRLWHITAGHVILATGAHQRPLLFADNDRPGIMLASALGGYLRRYDIVPPGPVVLATTGDDAYPLASELRGRDVDASVVDARPESQLSPEARAIADGLERVRFASAIAGSVAGVDGAVAAVLVSALDAAGDPVGEPEEWECTRLGVSGGWSPVVHLHSQRQGGLEWDAALAGFVPSAPVARQHTAGAINGSYSTALCLSEGTAAAAAALDDEAGGAGATTRAQRLAAAGTRAQLWSVTRPGEDGGQHFVDQHRDNTLADVARAIDAGMTSIEHIKRYTSIGTGADQGKTSTVPAIGAMSARLRHEGEITASLTAQRAPFTPVAFAALAGRSRGELFDPVRVTSAHDWHVQRGAVFEDVGQWKRPRYYPLPGEDMDAAVARECRIARESVAFMDASTLGKIEIRGADAAEFLGRVYTNGFAKLAVGKGRYGMMCTPDGMVFDDGVSLRLAEDRYLMSTTTGGAAKVLEWLEEWSQTEWPDLDVTFTSVTEQWAVTAVVGPGARAVVAALAPDIDYETFGFMEFRETTLASGVDARIARITFSGELAFEISVPTDYGGSVVEAVAAMGATPYGTETMHVLRAEKGYPIVGQDTDGTVTPEDLGMGWLISKQKDFIGKRSYRRASHAETGRKHWVSVLPRDPELVVPEGAQIVAGESLGGWDGVGMPPTPVPMLGHVTSSYRSQALGRSFGLALLKDGRDRIGELLVASFGGRLAEVEVGPTVLFDPEGERRDG